jgi:hypothetical protein
MSEREIERLIKNVADGDDEEIEDRLAALQEYFPVEGVLSGEMMAGVALALAIYGDEVDDKHLSAVLGETTPREITETAWGLRGRGYEGEPATGGEFAERVAAVIVMIYNEAASMELDLEKIIGHGRDVLPDLELGDRSGD